MEKLHATTLYLLRFGGMYPFKTNKYPNQIQISVWLLLWTLFLQLMNALSAMHYLVNNSNISSLHTFLKWVWNASWKLITILIPIHFMCHAKEIATVNRRIINVLEMCSCSINSLKMSIKIKLILTLSVIAQIFNAFVSVYIQTLLNCVHYDYGIVSKLTTIYLDCYALLVFTTCSLIFVMYLAILEEYFRYNDSCLRELFGGEQYFIRQIPIIPTKVYGDKPKNAATHPIGVHKSIHPHQSVNRIKTRSTLPCPRQTKDSRPGQLFTKAPRVRAKNVGTRTRVHDADTQDFIQNLGKIHASIFELYDIYELLKCILGFPLLCLIIVIMIDGCASTYVAVVGLRANCTPTIWIMLPLSHIFIISLIATVPHTLDDKVSNVISISFIKVYQ